MDKVDKGKRKLFQKSLGTGLNYFPLKIKVGTLVIAAMRKRIISLLWIQQANEPRKTALQDN